MTSSPSAVVTAPPPPVGVLTSRPFDSQLRIAMWLQSYCQRHLNVPSLRHALYPTSSCSPPQRTPYADENNNNNNNNNCSSSLPAPAPAAAAAVRSRINVAAAAILRHIPHVASLSSCCTQQICGSLQTFYGPHRPQGENLYVHRLVRLHAKTVKLMPLLPAGGTPLLDDHCLCASRALGGSVTRLEDLLVYHYRQPPPVLALAGSVPYEGLRRLLLGPSLPCTEGLTIFRVTRPEDADRVVALLAEGLRQRRWRRLRVGELPPKTSLAPLLRALDKDEEKGQEVNHHGAMRMTLKTAAKQKSESEVLPEDGEDGVLPPPSPPSNDNTKTTRSAGKSMRLEELELESLLDSLVRDQRLLLQLLRSPSAATLRRLSLRNTYDLHPAHWADLGTACGLAPSLVSLDLALCGLTDELFVRSILSNFASSRYGPARNRTDETSVVALHFDVSHNQLTDQTFQMWLDALPTASSRSSTFDQCGGGTRTAEEALEELSSQIVSLDISGNRFRGNSGSLNSTTTTAPGVAMFCRLLQNVLHRLLRLRMECTEWGTDGVKRIAKAWASSRRLNGCISVADLSSSKQGADPEQVYSSLMFSSSDVSSCWVLSSPGYRYSKERCGAAPDVELAVGGCPLSLGDWKAVVQAVGEVTQQLQQQYDDCHYPHLTGGGGPEGDGGGNKKNTNGTTRRSRSCGGGGAALVLYGQDGLSNSPSSSSANGKEQDTNSKNTSKKKTKHGSSSATSASSSSAPTTSLLFDKLGVFLQWVTWLDLRTCNLGHSGVLSLASALQAASSDGAVPLPLQVLKLCDNNLATPTPRNIKDAVPFLARCLRASSCPSLTELHLSCNDLSDHRAIVRLLEQTSGRLRVVNFTGNTALALALTTSWDHSTHNPAAADTRGHPKDLVNALASAQQRWASERQLQRAQQQVHEEEEEEVVHCELWLKDCNLSRLDATRHSKYHVEIVAE